MPDLSVVIVEDERVAADQLERMILAVDPGIRIVARLTSVRQAVKWFSSNRAKLIFMDIQLGDGQSFRIFEEVSIDAPVIFTTAYDQYAIRAFKANGIAYLLKPIDTSELEQAIARYRHFTGMNTDLTTLKDLLTNLGKASEFKQRFMVQAGSRIRSVPVDEISFFFFLDRSVFLCTREGKHLPLEFALDKIESLVDPDRFFRINRRMIVSIESIDRIVSLSKSRLQLYLKPAFEEDVLVSFNKTGAFREWLDR